MYGLVRLRARFTLDTTGLVPKAELPKSSEKQSLTSRASTHWPPVRSAMLRRNAEFSRLACGGGVGGGRGRG